MQGEFTDKFNILKFNLASNISSVYQICSTITGLTGHKLI